MTTWHCKSYQNSPDGLKQQGRDGGSAGVGTTSVPTTMVVTYRLIARLLSVFSTWLFFAAECRPCPATRRPRAPSMFYLSPNNSDLLEGDIMVRNCTKRRFASYAVTTDRTKIWPEAKVYYTIDDQFDEDTDKPLVLEAMRLVEAKTCVRFIERKTEASYLNIAYREGRCASHVGMAGGEQTLALDFYYCPDLGQIAHEFLHALGFYHEHSRPDRDDYVDIMWDNIQDGAAKNFDLKSATVADTLGQPYDYQSVMHYPYNTFAKDTNLPTIVAKDPSIGKDQLGKGYLDGFLTETDITKINILYECKAKR